MAPSLFSQAAVTASLTAFLYEGFTYNVIFVGRVLPAMGKEEQGSPLLVVFNVLLGLAVWSYLRTAWADPGAAPEEWHDFVRRVGQALPVAPGMKEWQPGKATMCRYCTRVRPERAHHCSLCGVCILRLDHHCPWLNNCVGFGNHKFFLLTCLYVLLACLVGILSTAPELLAVTRRLRLSVHGVPDASGLKPPDQFAFIVFGFLAVVICMFLGPLFVMQMQMAFSNKTTIEVNYSNMSNPFDQGNALSNLKQIFGAPGPDWLLPVRPWRPVTDGITFPRAEQDGQAPSDEAALMRSFTGSVVEEEMHLKGWAPALSHHSGEAMWRVHYNVPLPAAEGQQEAGKAGYSALDSIFGCMNLDCDGNKRQGVASARTAFVQ